MVSRSKEDMPGNEPSGRTVEDVEASYLPFWLHRDNWGKVDESGKKK